MRLSLLAAVAAAVLLGAPSPGSAQGPERRGNDAPGRGLGSPQARPDTPARPPAARIERNRPEPQARPERQRRERQAQPERRNEPRAERQRPSEPRRVQREERAPKAERRERSERKEQGKEPSKSTERKEQGKQPSKSTERKELGKEPSQTTREERSKQPGKQDARRDGDRAQPARQVQASDDQRRGVRERLFKQVPDRNRVDRSRVDFRLTVGERIPRRHRLRRLPPAIISFAPVYRGYSYIVVEDEICIVDPETYVIVDVIPASSQRADRPDRGPTLTLTAEEERFVYANVDRERRVDLRLRLALGAEIPREVDLRRFDERVLANLPKLEPYRYIVVDDDVVIVHPDDREIALVIDE